MMFYFIWKNISTMTETQKKANELIEMYIDKMPCLYIQTGNTIIEHAKSSAILCVDEILKIAVDISDEITWTKDFWQQVKEEIINYKN